MTALECTRIALSGLDKEVTTRSILEVRDKVMFFTAHVYGVALHKIVMDTTMTVEFVYKQVFPTTQRKQVTLDYFFIGENGKIEKHKLQTISTKWITYEPWLDKRRHVVCIEATSDSTPQLVRPSDPLIQPFFERMHECIALTNLSNIYPNRTYARLGSAIEVFRNEMIRSLQNVSSAASLVLPRN